MKSHQQALKEWLDNRIRFKTWFSKNTIHTSAVFDVLCRRHLRGGSILKKADWHQPLSTLHVALARVIKILKLYRLKPDRIDLMLDGFFTAQTLLLCANDKDVIELLSKRLVVWKKESRQR